MGIYDYAVTVACPTHARACLLWLGITRFRDTHKQVSPKEYFLLSCSIFISVRSLCEGCEFISEANTYPPSPHAPLPAQAERLQGRSGAGAPGNSGLWLVRFPAAPGDWCSLLPFWKDRRRSWGEGRCGWGLCQVWDNVGSLRHELIPCSSELSACTALCLLWRAQVQAVTRA